MLAFQVIKLEVRLTNKSLMRSALQVPTAQDTQVKYMIMVAMMILGLHKWHLAGAWHGKLRIPC